MGLHDFTFYDLIRRNAVAFGGRSAWYEVDDGRTWTFDRIRSEVDRLAAGLQQRGVIKGDRIGVLGKNSLEYFLVYGAAAAVGAIVLPVNWRLSGDEACFNLADGTPKMLFADAAFHADAPGQSGPAFVRRHVGEPGSRRGRLRGLQWPAGRPGRPGSRWTSRPTTASSSSTRRRWPEGPGAPCSATAT